MVWDPKFVYQEWPDQIFTIVNLYGHFGWGFGLWTILPTPMRALWAPGLPLQGSQAQAHHTHPAARQLEGGAHAS